MVVGRVFFVLIVSANMVAACSNCLHTSLMFSSVWATIAAVQKIHVARRRCIVRSFASSILIIQRLLATWIFWGEHSAHKVSHAGSPGHFRKLRIPGFINPIARY